MRREGLDGRGEELVGVGPVAGARRAEGAGEGGLGREAPGEGEEPAPGDGVGAPEGGGEVDAVEAGEVGLEELPPVDEELAEAYRSGTATP